MAGLVAAILIYGNAAFFSVINPAVFPGWAMGGNSVRGCSTSSSPGTPAHPFPDHSALRAGRLVLVTGVASYWFHPKSIPVVRQNRTIALSYYGCAAALVSVPAVAFIAPGR